MIVLFFQIYFDLYNGASADVFEIPVLQKLLQSKIIDRFVYSNVNENEFSSVKRSKNLFQLQVFSELTQLRIFISHFSLQCLILKHAIISESNFFN